MNISQAERFDEIYGRIWLALHKAEDDDLSQHEREVLHHVAPGGASLGWLAHHMALPKSTTSVLVKDLERRGFLRRTRDALDERRLDIGLTTKGRRRVEADSVLELPLLARALAALPRRQRDALLEAMEALADAAGAAASRAAR